MSSLPRFIDPRRASDKAKQVSGDVFISQLVRLRELVSTPNGVLASELRFEKCGRKIRIVGDVKGCVSMACQVCLEVVSIDILCDVRLEVVARLDRIESIESEFEPLLVTEEGGVIDLYKLVEDEVILAVPLYPKHLACNTHADGSVQAKSLFGGCSPQKPFEILNSLLDKQTRRN